MVATTKEPETLKLEGLGEVELVDQPQTDHLEKFIIKPKEHVEMLPAKERLAIAFKNRRQSKVRFIFPTPSPRKYKTPLHKRLEKLDKAFETAGAHRQVRILKHAMSLTERIGVDEWLPGRSKHVNRQTHKAYRNQVKY